MGCCPRMTLQGYGSRPILLFPAVPTGIPFPVDPDIDGTLSLTDPARILFPAVLTEFPVSINPVVALVPPDPTEFDTGSVVEGCCVDLPDKGAVRVPNTMGATVMMVGEVAQPACVRQDLLEASVPVMNIGIMMPVGDIPRAGDGASITAESKDPRNEWDCTWDARLLWRRS